MKKNFSIFGMALNFLLLVLSVVFSGGVALAVAADGQAMDPGSNAADPNANHPSEGTITDNPDKGLEQPGHASTASVLDNQGLTENHIDDYVSKYRAYRYPLHTDILRKARQIKVDVKEPTDWEVGEAVMELTTIGAITGGEGEVTITKGTHIAAADWNIIRANVTLMVGIPGGYQGSIADGSPLILFVTGKTKTEMTVIAVNGAPGSQNTSAKVVPTIAAGTTIFPMAPAMSESEVEIEPDNAMPTERACYLQKKVCAITYTELFERIKKKARWSIQDIKDYSLDMFRRICTRSMLISAPSKFQKYNAKTGWEIAYTEEGILRQMRLGYELTDAQLDFSDLIAIQAMLCGKYNTPYELTAYCGTKFVQRLLNIDFSKHKEYTVRNYTDETTKIKITSFESNFGTIRFEHEYGLDDLGYSECAIIFGVEEAKHFYYQKDKTLKINHEKGEGGEVREAKSEYYIKDDCVKLDTFNSMIVGPSTLVGGYKLSALDVVLKSVNELPATGSVGDIVYLIEDVIDENTGAVTNAMGLYKCKTASSGSGQSLVPAVWEPYDGKSTFIA